ncbi:hypothetical protein [Halorubrum sp. LN27]|uniref:hypothetical protein n=1 Tax=Halorubrum sp. LN27 TaxID=2801032 RepID=UPI00190D4B5F|nr:hypothetical protein [Halorubrum sp. LN27]
MTVRVGPYSEYPPEGEIPHSDEYAVEVGDVSFPTWQIDECDDRNGIRIHIDPRDCETFHPIPIDETVDVSTPIEEFVGKVDFLSIEHTEILLVIEKIRPFDADGGAR